MFTFVRRMWELAIRPGETWADIAAESGDPAELLLPWPALLMALGPGLFFLTQFVLGLDGARVALGRGLGFAVVYYALVVLCVMGEALVLRRVSPVLGSVTAFDDALKLAVYSSFPFHASGIVFFIPWGSWESRVLFLGILGVGYGGLWLYWGLGVLVRSDGGRRALLAAAGAGSFLVAWVLGFLLLKQVML